MLVAEINTLVDFCARRDVPVLSRDAAEQAAGGRIDVAILFGGSILAGGDVFARAVTDGVAERYLIVGGQGHSTGALREAMRHHLGWDDISGRTEASLFDRYLRERHGIATDLLEHDSTNCGSNVRNALALLDARNVPRRRIVLIQDGTMQRRMDAGFRLFAPDARIVNYAAHRTPIELIDGELGFRTPPLGMWAPGRYVSMLMGEIPRLTDDHNGYGPAGRGFIAHVDVPVEVGRAYRAIADAGVGTARAADPRWADAG